MTWSSFWKEFWDFIEEAAGGEMAVYTEPVAPQEPITEVQIANPMPNRLKLYNEAKACLGLDLSTDPAVPPEVSCAVAVNNVFKKTFGAPLGGGASTAAMYHVLQTDSRFQLASEPEAGDIIISPTGTSKKGAQHGHVGIVANYGILSNNSMNGLFEEYYTLTTWESYYRNKLGFPVLFFRVI